MEIDPRKVAVDLSVKVLFRFGKQLRRDSFNLDGEAAVDIKALYKSVLLHKIKVVVLFLEHRCLKIGISKTVDEFHLPKMVGNDAPRIDRKDNIEVKRVVVDVDGVCLQ